MLPQGNIKKYCPRATSNSNISVPQYFLLEHERMLPQGNIALLMWATLMSYAQGGAYKIAIFLLEPVNKLGLVCVVYNKDCGASMLWLVLCRCCFLLESGSKLFYANLAYNFLYYLSICTDNSQLDENIQRNNPKYQMILNKNVFCALPVLICVLQNINAGKLQTWTRYTVFPPIFPQGN